MSLGRQIPAVIMRGGTSKGVFLDLVDMPPSGAHRDAIALEIMGSPDPMQIDGLGGTYSSTSKIMLVGPADPPHDIIYWFGQVSIDRGYVDWSGNCGNLTTAVAPYALLRGLIRAVGDTATFRLLNGNTGTSIEVDLELADGLPRVEGDLIVPGVPSSGSPITTRYLDPVANSFGGILPTGRAIDVLSAVDGEIEVSIVNVVHPNAFVNGAALGLDMNDLDVDRLNKDANLLELLEQIRGECAVLMGRAATRKEALVESPIIPRLTVVGTVEGADRGAADLTALGLSMGKVHRALPVSGALCVAAASCIEGTVPHRVRGGHDTGLVRVNMPKGVLHLDVEFVAGPEGQELRSVGIVRTARPLMSGFVFLKELPAPSA